MDFIPLAIPFFLGLLLAELLWSRLSGRAVFSFADTLCSLSMGTLSRLRGFLVLGVGGMAWAQLEALTPLPAWPLDHPLSWIIAFVAYDFCYYLAHRAGHRVNILWASHVAHHQSEAYNLSTALRQTSTGFLTFVFYLPMLALGVPAELMVAVGSLNLIYQFWVHTQAIHRLGPLERILVTPANHRVHHASNPEYIDKNFGGVFILWDRMLGTYEDERADCPPRFGLPHALGSFNPIWANAHHYWALLRHGWASGSLSGALRLALAGPETLPPPPAPLETVTAKPALGPGLTTYLGVQFLVITALGLLPLLGQEAPVPQTPFVLWLVLSLACLGACLDGRPYAKALELGRQALVLLGALVLPAAPLLSGLAIFALLSALAALRLIPQAPQGPGPQERPALNRAPHP